MPLPVPIAAWAFPPRALARFHALAALLEPLLLLLARLLACRVRQASSNQIPAAVAARIVRLVLLSVLADSPNVLRAIPVTLAT